MNDGLRQVTHVGALGDTFPNSQGGGSHRGDAFCIRFREVVSNGQAVLRSDHDAMKLRYGPPDGTENKLEITVLAAAEFSIHCASFRPRWICHPTVPQCRDTS